MIMIFILSQLVAIGAFIALVRLYIRETRKTARQNAQIERLIQEASNLQIPGAPPVKNFALEFPDFDPATLPRLPQAFEDISYGNDACPSFHNDELRLSIFIDYEKMELREFEGETRFHIFKTDEDGGRLPEDDASFTSDNWSDILAYVLAEHFVRVLKQDFTVKDWEEMRRRNATPEYNHTDACASHDFCDSNMLMLAAWRKTFGEPPLPPSSIRDINHVE